MLNRSYSCVFVSIRQARHRRFPDVAAARSWYRSPAYQEILRLRTDNSTSDIIIVGGVGPNHLALTCSNGIAVISIGQGAGVD